MVLRQWYSERVFCMIFFYHLWYMLHCPLTHWSRVTHICVGNLTIIGSDNGLSPGRRQAIIWTNAGILLIVPLGTNFNEIVIGIQTLSFKKMHLKMSSTKWRPFCLGLNELSLSVPFIYTGPEVEHPHACCRCLAPCHSHWAHDGWEWFTERPHTS